MDYQQVKTYLYGLLNYGTTYGIDRMRLLSEIIGNPEKNFPVVHVAGTNGKGSVCAMLEGVYRKNGYRTGLFTSPHLVHLEERIQVNREKISALDFIEYVEGIKRSIENSKYADNELRPSFFEMLNAAGFLYFSKRKIDIGIIETGLGGRFDSTNIVKPLVSVISSISRDHTEILGENLESIAMAKAGIIKKNTPVVIGPMPKEAETVIRIAASEQNSPIFSVEEIYGKNPMHYPLTSLQGTYQRFNAATAALTLQVTKTHFPIDDETSKQALKAVDWPGRWQSIFTAGKKLILDCTHNEGGANGLAENLERLVQEDGQKPIIIVGVLGIYRAKVIIPIVSQYAETIILVEPKSPKAIDTHTLKTLIPKNFNGTIIKESIANIFPLPSTCNIQTDGRHIVAVGSTYLVGEILERI